MKCSRTGTPNRRTDPTEPGVAAAGVVRSSANKTPALILTQAGDRGWLLVIRSWLLVAGYWPDRGVVLVDVDNEVMGKPKASEKNLTDAANRSREAQLRGPARPIDWKKVDAITRKIAALAVLDPRPADEILGYDEFGLPS